MWNSHQGRIKRIVQREFRKQAEEFSRSQEMREKGGLRILPRLAQVKPTHRVLDVACGPGFVALEFAKHSREVVGVDLTGEMIKKARALARQEKVRNVTFRCADVNHLPFSPSSFDRVITRASFHHFREPERALREMVRVLEKKGKILISDNTSKDDPAKGDNHNLIERLRDPSHVEMLPPKQWRALFKACGLKVLYRRKLVQQRNVEDWMRLSRTPTPVKKKIRRLLLRSISGDRTGQNVRLSNGEIVFDMNYMIFVLARTKE